MTNNNQTQGPTNSAEHDKNKPAMPVSVQPPMPAAPAKAEPMPAAPEKKV